MARVTFEITVDLPEDERFRLIQLQLLGERRNWFTALLFGLPRFTRVREGKHLRITETTMTVVKVGDEDGAAD